MTLAQVIHLLYSNTNLKARRVLWEAMGDKEKHICLGEGWYIMFRQYSGNFARRWTPMVFDAIAVDWEVFS